MRKISIGMTYSLAVLLAVLIAGCGQETVTVPSVVSTIPANGAMNVAINTPISATFSMAMNSASITSSTFTVTGPGGAVAGAVTYSGLTATFAPAAALAYATTYTGTITTGATDPGGTPLLGNYVWTFTTITPPPTVVSNHPCERCHQRASRHAHGRYLQRSNDPVLDQHLNVYADRTGRSVRGRNRLVLWRNCPFHDECASRLQHRLHGHDHYRSHGPGRPATGGQLRMDVHDHHAAANGDCHDPGEYQATGVPINQVLSATFNEAMNCATLASPATTFTLTGPGTTAVAGTVACAGALATFTPAADLAFNTVYTATDHHRSPGSGGHSAGRQLRLAL